MTNNVLKTELDEIYKLILANKNKIALDIFYLKDRWSDEKEYEDFNEYKKVLKSYFKDTGFTVKKVSKAFTVTFQRNNVETTVKFSASGNIKGSAKLIG